MVRFLEIYIIIEPMLVYKGHLCIANKKDIKVTKKQTREPISNQSSCDFLSHYHLSCDNYLPMVWLSCALLFALICH